MTQSIQTAIEEIDQLEAVELEIAHPINQPIPEDLPETMQSIKFMDDATVQEVLNLTNTLCSNINRSGPLPFHESSGKVLPSMNSLLQQQINQIKQISDGAQ